MGCIVRLFRDLAAPTRKYNGYVVHLLQGDDGYQNANEGFFMVYSSEIIVNVYGVG